MPKEITPNEKEQLFLNKYRALEKTLAEHSMMVADLEKCLESQSRQAESTRLRICRQVRNFIVHDSPGFIGVTDAMIEFISDLEYEASRAGGTAQTIMVTPAAYGCVKISEPVSKAASVLYKKKRGDVIITDQKGIFLGLLAARGLAAALADPDAGWTLEKLHGKKLLRQTKEYVLPDVPAHDLPATRALVLDRETRKVLGVINEDAGWIEHD